jgi:hypothetical protein
VSVFFLLLSDLKRKVEQPESDWSGLMWQTMMVHYYYIYNYIYMHVVIYDYIWLFLIIYDYIWLYMLCIAMLRACPCSCWGKTWAAG